MHGADEEIDPIRQDRVDQSIDCHDDGDHDDDGAPC